MKCPTRLISFPLMLLSVVSASIGCVQEDWTHEQERQVELIEKANLLAERHASTEECEEALGAPEWTSEIEGWLIWRYRLKKPIEKPANWLTLTFDGTTRELFSAKITYVDSFNADPGSDVSPISE